jgi:hypothetical protein
VRGQHEMTSDRPGRVPMWAILTVVVTLGPAVWFLHLSVSYWLVPVTCRVGGGWPIHVTTVVAMALVAALVVGAARLAGPSVREGMAWLVRSSGPDGFPSGSGADFLVALGWLLAVFFVVVVVGAGLPALILRPCA